MGAFSITNAEFNTTPVETPDRFDNKGGATACISANGTSNAIAWVMDNSGGDQPATPAFCGPTMRPISCRNFIPATNWPPGMPPATAVKFTTPTIANGKVYVGAQYSLTVYGLATLFVVTPGHQSQRRRYSPIR